MIRRLVTFSVNHPVSLVALLLAACLGGLFCCFTVDADFIPQISQREMLVSASYQGLDPGDMERLVTQPLEDGLATMKGLKSISAVTRPGLSLLRLELHWGVDMDLALVECRELVDLCYSQLPSRCQKPQVMLPSRLGDAMMVAVIPQDNDLRYGRHLVEKDMKGRFQRLEACGGVRLIGGEVEEVKVLVDYDAMEAKGLSLEYISQQLASSNFQYPAGTIEAGEKELLVKTNGLYQSFEEMEDTPLLYGDRGLVRLSHVARVEMGSQERETFFLYGGRPALCLSISKADDASPVALSRQVTGELQELRRQYGDFYEFVVLKDLSTEVTESLLSLGISAVVGMVVAAAVILYFLRCWRVSVLLASIIPLCGLLVVLVLSLAGATINLMSLCGIAVGIGMVVDAGAVVLENLNRKRVAPSLRGKAELRQMIVEGTLEVALSNTGSAITTAAVFLPLFFLQGLMGELFAQLALAVVAAIVASCLLSLTYIPAMYQFLAERKGRQSLEAGDRMAVGGAVVHPSRNRFLENMELRYRRVLTLALDRTSVVVASVVGCLLLTLLSVLLLDYQLLPQMREDSMQAQVVFPFGTTVSSMEQVALEMQQLLEAEGLQEVAIFGGLESTDYQGLSQPQQDARVIQVVVWPPAGMKLDSRWLEGMLSGRNLSVSALGNQDILSQLLGMEDRSFILSVEPGSGGVQGRHHLAAVASALLEQFPHFQALPATLGVTPSTTVGSEGQVASRRLIFQPDRLAASRFSTNSRWVAAAVHQLTEGLESGAFHQEGRTIPLRVQLDGGQGLTAGQLATMNIQVADSLRIPLGLLGSFREEASQEVLYRYNRRPALILQPQSASIMAGEQDLDMAALGDMDGRVEGVQLVGMQEMERNEMMGNGMALLVVALLLLYFIIGAQFESFLIPLLLLVTLPPAFCGALLLTVLTGHVFSMNTVIALVVLFGTAVNNGILLYEGILLQGGFTREAIVAASVSKLRTILVTNLTTIFALLPFAIDPWKTSSQSSLAVAIVGGLFLSMMLVLVLMPVVFSCCGRLADRRCHD